MLEEKIKNLPDLQKEYLFQVYLNELDDDVKTDFMLRIKAADVLYSLIALHTDEFEDLFILNNEKLLKKVKTITIRFYKNELKEFSGEVTYKVKFNHLRFMADASSGNTLKPTLYFDLKKRIK